MDVHFSCSRAGGAAAATALLLCTSLAAADAASSAQAASAAAAVTSGSWGAVATTSATPPYGNSPLVLTMTTTTDTRSFNVVNTGTLPLTGVILQATTNRGAAVIEACTTTWNEPLHLCSLGSITVAATSGTGATTYAVPLPTGSSVRLRARTTSGQRNFTLTIGLNVTRTQARAATTSGN